MGLKGRTKKGCLLTSILCVALYLGLLISLRLMQTPIAPITWKVEVPGNGYFSSGHVCQNGNFACVTSDKVVFISPAGAIISEHHPSGTNFGSGAMDGSGNLYVGGDEAYVYAYSPDGAERWALQLPSLSLGHQVTPSSNTSCRVDSNGNVIVLGDGGELAVLTADGVVKQHTVLPFPLSNLEWTVGPGKDQIAVIKNNQGSGIELAVVDLAGNEIWAQSLSGRSVEYLELSGDMLIVHERHAGMEVFALNGDPLWTFHNQDPQGAHTYHSYEGVKISGEEIYYFSGSVLFSLDREGQVIWQLANDGVALPLRTDGNHVLFAQYTVPASNSRIRNWIIRYVPYGLGYLRRDRHVELVDVVGQHISLRWKLPDSLLVVMELGKDGEVYGYTKGISYQGIPLTLYRFDL